MNRLRGVYKDLTCARQQQISMQVGLTSAERYDAPPSYLSNADPGRHGAGTLTANSVEPTLEQYENIFGPSARDIKQDLQRFKRHGRWHLPDILKGPNQYLTDRIDGLITDATNSPFTSKILPYKYITNVDGKIKWNVWSFDEGLAARVPYESAARTLQQSKRSYAGYTIRQGMAIVLEHNFMMTDAGRENFKNQLNQLIGSIQLTNDLDVHVALVLAPSYQKTMSERYMSNDKSSTQICREFVEMFGFVQKNQNALDILIEEAKGQLRTWGAPMPDFMLCNSKLTFQLTMTPDATNYVTQGPEGPKRLKAGPVMQSYRGIGIVHSKAFSMETGTPPRDILRRRVRVAEYYRILPHRDNHKRLFQLYNEERDTWSTFTFADLIQKAACSKENANLNQQQPGHDNDETMARIVQMMMGSDVGAVDAAAEAVAPRAGRAPMLGRAIQPGSVDQSMEGNLTELYKQIFTGALRRSFFTNVQFVDHRVVYVPGAMDFSIVGVYDNIRNPANLVNYAQPIQNAIRMLPAPLAWGGDEQRLGKIQIQSVALYPRQVNSFMAAVRAGAAAAPFSDAFNFPEHFMPSIGYTTVAARARHAIFIEAKVAAGAGVPWATARGGIVAAVAAAAGGAGAGGAPAVVGRPAMAARGNLGATRLRIDMAARNFNRYGVPTQIVSRAGWGRGGDDITTALRVNVDTSAATFQHLNQYLRNRGAFNCPNHFKEEGLPFGNIGDLLGYNVLMTRELLIGLAERSNARLWAQDPSIYLSTFLYDIVFNPRAHEALLTATAGLLDAVKTRMVAAAAVGPAAALTRSDLAVALNAAIVAALTANRVVDGATFDQLTRITGGWESYWLWPRTESSREEVFSEDNMAEWAVWTRAQADFNNQYTVTNALATAIAGAPVANFPRNTVLNMAVPLGPHAGSPADREAALNFYRMLAWRLWADQEIGLEEVYNMAAGGGWPEVHAFLHPQDNYAHQQFGVGTMVFGSGDPQFGVPGNPGTVSMEQRLSRATEHVEIVIVRPNIEHHMLGIILGLGGESLGSTFWGQTELSCYDDSMHGIWGMSYKYNERAIVINERNLVRLWDIAYDGYVGGKEDSALAWNSQASRDAFMSATTDVTRPYRGQSMMVMAFNHAGSRRMGSPHSGIYKSNFQSNWPSPIVFYDTMAPDTTRASADFDNVHVVETQQFRVFNNPLYENAYRPYLEKMPNFQELHTIRKNAGLSATENEATSESLAFQGTLRIVSAENGCLIDEVKGSGHHGPDFVGCASLRAGKGYKINSQPTIQRLV